MADHYDSPVTASVNWITYAAFSLRQARGNDSANSGLSSLGRDTATMAQEFQSSFQTSRIGDGRAGCLDQRWVAGLIDAMEQAARPEIRQVPCDRALIMAAKAHLARPAVGFAHCGSAYSLRN